MKDLKIPGDGSVHDNERWMQTMADEIFEGYSYNAELTEDELIAERETFGALSIQIAQIEEEKQRFLAEINERLKKKKGEAAASLMLIRTQRREVVGTAYQLTDEKLGRIGLFDVNGKLLSSRPKSGNRKSLFVGDALPYVDDDVTDNTTAADDTPAFFKDGTNN
mgnify:CR=1 FL=1